ncbi:helix-turn-helix transcriptional regulator [Kitasatospora sp. A2-31]|uniref:helix-turn-helix transcriptional regulator n=1 Tax=Kitasatospora sp. A2-31 TaxID=2916414 RepID=UPI001EEA2702|nr:helix-turn-helix transcriptional regulator [Kitasatospora sp. A2-31]MCG6497646.1 helix-turn-helix domain-containing protein [Kitasatospora sp. A2-31]
MKLEESIGANIARLREMSGLSQAQLGDALGRYLEKPWSRQAVSAAEKGRRAFTAVELVSLSLALSSSVPDLLLPTGDSTDGEPLLPGPAPVNRSDYERILFRDSDQADPVGPDAAALSRARNLVASASHLQHKALQLGSILANAAFMLDQASLLLGAPGEAAETSGEMVSDGRPVTITEIEAAGGSVEEAIRRSRGTAPGADSAE